MRLTSKGQVTIPKHIREKLGVRPGDEIGFREEGQQVLLVNEGEQDILPPRREGESDGDFLVRSLGEFGRKHLIKDELGGKTVDQIMEDLRGYSEDANDPGFQRRP